MKIIATTTGLLEVVRFIWLDATSYVRVRLRLVLLLVLVASVLTAIGPVALKLIVDGLAGHTETHPVSLALLITAYALSQFLSRTIGEIRGLLYARAERRMFRTLSERLFAHLMRLPLRFHLNRRTGAVSQTLDNGLQGYQMVLHHLVFTFLPVAAELGTTILILTKLAPPVFLVIFCGALISYGFAFGYSATTIAAAAEDASCANLDSNAAIVDGLLCVETVKYFTAEGVVQERVSRALARTEHGWVNFYRRYAINGFGVAAIFTLFLAVTAAYAAHEVGTGRMTVGDFVLVNSYMLQVVRPVEMLGFAMQALSQGVALLKQMIELFRESPESEPGCSPETHEIPQDRCAPSRAKQHKERRHSPGRVGITGRGALEFVKVSCSYGAERPVLQDVTFFVPAGKTLGIVGPSGAGKSTIVRLLARLYEPESGRILLDGVALSELSLQEVRQAVAVVPQETVLFNDTLAYNIGLGKTNGTIAEIEQAARLAHLHDFIMTLPDGYETQVGERGVKLSGGEKQRVSIARAAIRHPRIFVFDEATSSLDSRSEQVIQQNLREIARESTTLIIAHRLSTVVHADEIIVLDRGVVTERGTHLSLLERQGSYAALWEVQQRGRAAA